jgi:sigma-B regulation protein RsbU (phosphoserine phosphatase)
MPKLQPFRPFPKFHYGFLILLFLLCGAQQIRHIGFVLHNLRGEVDVVRAPFSIESGIPVIEKVEPEAAKAGLQQGDRVLSVNSEPYRGPAQFSRALLYAQPGSPLSLTIGRSDSGNRVENLAIPLSKKASRQELRLITWIAAVGIMIVRPLFCILLGFWVVAARPRSFLAWLMLGLMLGFSQLVWNGIEDREGTFISDAALAYRSLVSMTWYILLLLIGIYFPFRLDLDRRRPWLKWLLIGPMMPIVLLSAFANVAGNRDYSFEYVGDLLYRLSPVTNVLILSSIILFFAIVGAKYFLEKTRDGKRRLQLFYLGTFLALMPMLILEIIRRFIGGDWESLFPEWVLLPSLLMLLLFPLTLAYLILVHKAMDVSVVVRQGVQYALARGGVKVLQGAMFAGVVLAISYAVSTQRMKLSGIIALVAVSVFVILQLQRIGARLAKWIDRLFFRESYDAELLLSELGEKVRTIVETRPLLETIVSRIGETLHVPRIAVLLANGGPFHPVYAVGYSEAVDFEFPDGGTAELLRKNRTPARVYLSDPENWANNSPAISEAERQRLDLLQAELLLPLHTKEELLGFICLGQKRSEAPYSLMDVRLLGSVAANAAMALENAQLTAAIAEEVAQRERLNRDLEIAREVQEHLFPQTTPSIDALDCAGACKPALGVGGDYYDFIEMPEGKLCFAIGDVSGKGIPAALMMSNLQAALRSHTLSATNELASIVSRINQMIYQSSSSSRYATFFLGQYDPSNRQLTYVNAGHNAPMLFRAGGELERLSDGGLVVGLLADVAYHQATLTVGPGDLLVAFTDGITEAMNTEDQEWGEEALIQTIRDCADLESRELLKRVMCEAEVFASGSPQHDDMTLVILKQDRGRTDLKAAFANT